MDQFEFFGNESQVHLQQRLYRLWPYLKAHPRLSTVGRAIAIDEPTLGEVENLIGLTMELGVLGILFTPPTIVDELRFAFRERGLKEVGLWNHLISNENTEMNSHAVVETFHLPPGYQIERISTATLPEQLLLFQELMNGCGISPPPGYILRGQEVPAIAEMVFSPQDEIVAAGAGIFRHNPEGTFGKAAHVGFLATEPSQRKNGFARLLLARIIIACYEEYSAELVHTGVRPDNIPSQRVCQKCGLEDSGMFLLAMSYPQKFKQGEFTR